MFGPLKKYVDEGYLKEHPVIEFETESGFAEYAIFAVAAVNKWDSWYRFIDAAGQTDFETEVGDIRGRALYDTGIQQGYGQQLLTLSTCYHGMEDGRLLVIAVETQEP